MRSGIAPPTVDFVNSFLGQIWVEDPAQDYQTLPESTAAPCRYRPPSGLKHPRALHPFKSECT